MAIDVRVIDGEGNGTFGHVQPFTNLKSQHQGQLVLQERFINLNPESHVFLHPVFGAAMNQAVQASGTPLIIHAGVDTGFADSGNVTSNSGSLLIDSGATFQADSLITIGSSVFNATSGTYANVVSIDSEIQLTLDSAIFISGTNAYEINPIWTGDEISGNWNFASGGKITLTNGGNNAEARFDFDEDQRTYGMVNFSSLTGKIDLDTYGNPPNSLEIRFRLSGSDVGNKVDIDNYIDTGDFSEQSFSIPKADFGLVTQDVNELEVKFKRGGGGANATFKLDDLQLESSTGGVVTPATFYSRTPFNTIFHVQEVRAQFADLESGTVSGLASGTENATMPGLSYNKILGLPKLTNGIVVIRQQDGVVKDAFVFRQLSDLLTAGGEITTAISDGTNTMVTVSIRFPEPIVMNGQEDSFISITVNDDLSGLLQFTASARGAIEV